jgi:hypothetical protein
MQLFKRKRQLAPDKHKIMRQIFNTHRVAKAMIEFANHPIYNRLFIIFQ